MVLVHPINNGGMLVATAQLPEQPQYGNMQVTIFDAACTDENGFQPAASISIFGDEHVKNLHKWLGEVIEKRGRKEESHGK